LEAENKGKTFEQVILPHLASAYNLARWLTRSDQDAEDLVQEASLRAFRFFDSFRGESGRVWLLTIVRNTCYTWRKGTPGTILPFDEKKHGPLDDDLDSERVLSEKIDSQSVREAIEALPGEFREVIVLCELEGLSYREIAAVTGVPMGTVMSRLARARKRLRQILTSTHRKED
jgi:RNA polymerase sigma-70 factor, ECF subfamily